MRLGISYNIFEGEELFPTLVKNIRNHVDYITVCYQNYSLKGNPARPELLSNLKKIEGIDKLFLYNHDYSRAYKENELIMRNLGLEECRKANCTHHITADVDEFYKPNELEYSKKLIEENDYNCSVVELFNYYKDPTFQIVPTQHHKVCFIQKSDINYSLNRDYPFRTDFTRRPEKFDKNYVFGIEEIAVHHMSFVRHNIRPKLENTSNKISSIERLIDEFNKYKVGDRVCLPPDYRNHKTILVEDFFKLREALWEHHQ